MFKKMSIKKLLSMESRLNRNIEKKDDSVSPKI
jgi:hypothetical protein